MEYHEIGNREKKFSNKFYFMINNVSNTPNSWFGSCSF